MWKRSLILLVGLVALAGAVSIVTMQPSAQAQSTGGGDIQIDLMVVMPAGSSTAALISNIGSSGEDGVSVCGKATFNVDSFFDVWYANIGSSGLDGVSFAFDSFFDIDVSAAGRGGRTVQTEMLSMSLSATLADPTNPNGVMDDLRCQVEAAGGDVYYGHVTVLK